MVEAFSMFLKRKETEIRNVLVLLEDRNKEKNSRDETIS
jgi:hypothetical protein